jgi:flagellar hook-basal body complex protein FliE
MSGINRPNGVQGTNTSNVSAPGMDVINNNSTTTGKIGAPPPAKTDAQAPQKGGGSFADIAKLASETFSKIADVAIAAINKAMPGGGKEADASAAGNDPAKTETAADKSASSAADVATKAIDKIVAAFDKVMAAFGKAPADGKVAEAKGAGEDAETEGAGKDSGVSAAGKDDVAKAAKDAVNKIEAAVTKKSEPADSKSIFAKKGEQAADKPAMGVFEADVAKSAFNAIRDVANAKQAKDTAEA